MDFCHYSFQIHAEGDFLASFNPAACNFLHFPGQYFIFTIIKMFS